MSDVELRELRYFVAVAEEEHLGRAAARLGVSASPLSRQIRRLEARAGLPLMEHGGRRIRLTPAGRRFLDLARELLAAAAAFDDHLRAERGEPPATLAVGAVDGAVHAGVLADGLAAVTDALPGTAVQVILAGSGAQLDLLRRGELDVALVHTPPPAGDPVLTAHRVLDDPVVLVAPAGHPAATAAVVTPDLLDGTPWATRGPSDAPAGHARFLAAAQAAGFTPDVRYEVGDLALRVALAAAGLACTLVQAGATATLVPAGAPVVTRSLPWLPIRVTVDVAHRHRPPRAARPLLDRLLAGGRGAGGPGARAAGG
jgi:DNA-binding transcriptional LysR family regulator